MKIELEGVNELEAKLQKLSESMREEIIEEGLLRAAEPIRKNAEQRAPMRTGNLKENIYSSVDPKDKRSVDVGPGPSAFYGLFLELGTQKMSARPFLRPAFDSNKKAAQKIFSDYVRKIIEAVK